MQIIVNGDPLEIEDGITLSALLLRVGKPAEHVAIERNGDVVDPAEFAATKLCAEDKLEVVHFVGGG